MSDWFVRTFVVGIGAVSGLFLKAGVDPEQSIINALVSVGQAINPQFSWWLFLILPIVATIGDLVIAYAIGGGIGILAIALAFIGTFILPSSFGVILIFAGMILGAFCDTKRN